MSAPVSERVIGWLSRRMAGSDGPEVTPGPPRRSFLGGAALVGAAVASSPWGYLTRPASAYDAVCGSGNTCNDGWSVFCCTINGGQNSCPPDTFVGGWWKADNSSFCGGSARYYIDCNAYRDGAWSCRCDQSTCDQRLVACNQFRYGQCNTQIPWSNTGPVVCRVVSCTPPWVQFGGVCTSSSATDNNTATHNAPCLVVAPALRVGTVGTDDVAVVKSGALDAPWTTVGTSVVTMALAGTRVATLDRSGVARAQEGDLGAAAVVLATGVAALAVGETRVAVVGTDGVARAKDGPLTAPWVTLADRVAAVAVQGARLAVVRDGAVLVKDGGLTAPWTTLATGAAAVALDGQRIAVLQQDGTLLVKDGAVTAPWTVMATAVAAVDLSGTRIAVTTRDGRFLVKEGDLGAAWTTVAAGVTSGAVQGQRVGVVDAGGRVLVKEGGVTANWVVERTGARLVVLS